jgi:hypothetical protein
MPFQKGQSGNPSGRKPGSKNKISEEIRERLSHFINNNIETIIEDFKNMKPSYRWKFFSELLPYVTPRLSATDNQHSFEKMTDEELTTIIEELKKTANHDAE